MGEHKLIDERWVSLTALGSPLFHLIVIDNILSEFTAQLNF